MSRVRTMLTLPLWQRPLLPPLAGRQDVPWLGLVSCWVVSCVLVLCMALSVLAKPQANAAPMRRSGPVAKKGAGAAALSGEKRLQLALDLMRHQQWPQAVQIIGPLDGIPVVTPTMGRLWFLRALLAQKLADMPNVLHAFTQ